MKTIADRLVSLIANRGFRTIFAFILAVIGFGISGGVANAATLYIAPASGSYDVGKTFTVNVMVASSDQAANAYSGTVTFPSDILELTALGKAGSVVSLWVQEPSFSAGRATFEGVTFNPGFQGGAGRIITLTFKAKVAGTATVRLSSGSILANDGEGTNILKGLGSATFTIGDGGAPEPEPLEVTSRPSTPRITSPTHPDSAKWYAVNDATFRWGLQTGVDAVNILADQNQNADPGTSSDGLFSSYTYDDVEDGAWFFHLRVRNKNGWSGVAHFPFQIDTKKPDRFTVTNVTDVEASQGATAFLFDAFDAGSGIDHFEIQFDGGATEVWKDDGSHIYRVPSLGPGGHAIVVKALDKAGNSLEQTRTFTSEGLMSPRITEYPKSADSGDSLVIKGMTYPNSEVTLWIQQDSGNPYSANVLSDEAGKFVYLAEERLVQGTYRFWATVTDSLGHASESSEKIIISVKPAPFDVWGWLVGLFAHLTISNVLNLILFSLLVYSLRRRKKETKQINKDVYGVQETLHVAFDLLKDDIESQVKLLEKTKSKRELTIEEGKILKKLKRDLDVAEGVIRKKISRIKRDV